MTVESPIVVDGDLSEEKISELIERRTEYPELDYKRRVDLSERRDEVEIAKDIGAMQVMGGYILIGVDDNGSVTSGMDDVDLRPFDEASLKAKLLKYLPEPLGLSTRRAKRNGHVLVVIGVYRHPDGCAYMKADGSYTGSNDGKTVTVFRAGDSFWRDGTQSVRLTQEGHREIVRRQVAAQKKEWIEDQREIRQDEATEQRAASKGRTLAEAELGAVNLDLSPRDLSQASLEFVRRGDQIGLTHLFYDARRRARSFVESEDKESLDDLLDQLTCLAAIFLAYNQQEWFERVIALLVEIYAIPFEKHEPRHWGYANDISPDDFAPKLWLAILERVFALGALVVRLENWEAVKTLTLQLPKPLAEEGYEANWLRHGITMASRARHFRETDTNGREKELSLLSLARTVVVRLECVRPDLRESDTDNMLTSLTQFDFLFNVVAVGGAKSVDGKVFYPSFARFRQARIQPIANRLLEESNMRRVLFPLDDQELAVGLNKIGECARSEGWRFDGFEGWRDGQVGGFIAKHHPNAAEPTP